MARTPSVPARTIALINQKGGVGKTTTTVNLAAAIALGGGGQGTSPEAGPEVQPATPRRVLVVDMDPQAHATLHLGVTVDGETPTVYDVLHDPSIDAASVLQKARENLYVLPAETGLAAAESELTGGADRLQRLRVFLDRVQSGAAGVEPFDFILIDCPPSLGLLTLNALVAAREIFIPMQAHFLALQGVGKLLETVSAVAKSINQRLHVTGVIVCMHDASSTHSREVIADLDAFFEQARTQAAAEAAGGTASGAAASPWRAARVYRPPIRRNIKLAESPSFGQTIFDYAPQCPGALDYRELAATVIGEWDKVLERRAEGAAGATPRPAGPPASRPARPATAPAMPAAAPHQPAPTPASIAVEPKPIPAPASAQPTPPATSSADAAPSATVAEESKIKTPRRPKAAAPETPA